MFRTININNESTCYSINEYGEVINDKTNKKLKSSITRSGYHYYRFSIRNKKCIYGYLFMNDKDLLQNIF